MIIFGIPAGLLCAIGAFALLSDIFCTGYSYAKNILIEAEFLRETHPFMAKSACVMAKIYMGICYLFATSICALGFTAGFFFVASLLHAPS